MADESVNNLVDRPGLRGLVPGRPIMALVAVAGEGARRLAHGEPTPPSLGITPE